MKFKSIEFTRKFNLGNFESQDLKIAADIDESENVDEAIKALKQKVNEQGASR